MQQPSQSLLASIEATVSGGKAVVTADDSVIVAMMMETLARGRSATFYVPPERAEAVMRWYWTPQRIKAVGMELVSEEERARIEKKLGVKDMGPWYSNRLQCGCGGVYGAYEFIEQGLKQHGKDWVGAVVEMKNTAVLRINPAQKAFCPQCSALMMGNHWYEMLDGRGTMIYGCCSGEIGGGTILA
jgi:hypothetical protein